MSHVLMQADGLDYGDQDMPGRYGVIESVRRIIDGLSLNWLKEPLPAVLDRLRQFGVDVYFKKTPTQPGTSKLTPMVKHQGQKFPVKSAHPEFAGHVKDLASKQVRVASLTNQDVDSFAVRKAQHMFRNAPEIAALNLDHSASPQQLVDQLKKKAAAGEVLKLPYGAANQTSRETIKMLVQSVFPNFTYEMVNGEGFIVANDKNNRRNISMNADPRQPGLIFEQIARWVNKEIDRRNDLISKYNAENPKAKKPLLKKLDWSLMTNVVSMRRVLREYCLFDENLKPGSAVLMRSDSLLNASKVSAWLAAPVASYVQSMQKAVDAPLLRQLNAKFERHAAEAAILDAKVMGSFTKRNQALMVVQRLVPDQTGYTKSGGYEVLDIVNKDSKANSRMKLVELSPGYYDFQNYRGAKLGVIEVSREGVVSFFNANGQRHNDYGPAVRYPLGSVMEPEYFMSGAKVDQSMVEAKLSAEMMKLAAPVPMMPRPPQPSSVPMPEYLRRH